MSPDQEYVLKTVKSRDVHFVRFWFTDVMGNMKSFAVSPNELENAFEEGMGFDGSCVDGFVGAGKRYGCLPRRIHVSDSAVAPRFECRGSHVLHY